MCLVEKVFKIITSNPNAKPKFNPLTVIPKQLILVMTAWKKNDLVYLRHTQMLHSLNTSFCLCIPLLHL